MATTEDLMSVHDEPATSQLSTSIPTPEDTRNSTTSMISVALSDNEEAIASSGSSASEASEPSSAVTTTQDDTPKRAASIWNEEEDARKEEEDHVFKVPALPSPRKDKASKSRHTRSKSSLQEPEMAALLARLEMENNVIAKDPKSGIATVGAHTGPGASFEYRVRDTVCSSLSLVTIPEEALGMSLGDFWSLVTRDYQAALRQLPTMTPLMIHKGIPDFLRSAVWVGIAGAWDASLQVEYDSLRERLLHEKPQNEHIINKDLARCFPHHEMFRDPEGEGQKMLGTVLKCYSLYDTEIGYCQGMAFVAGALLMNMPAKDAFCVFVKLMENHDLRSVYSPSLSGLHSRTFQLKKLLAQISPDLLDHLSNLGFELSYLAQFFMTMFATSCPLNVLFRIYDVVFAEGSDETMMRVALALILSNEHKLMAMKELEDVLHLLLGRRLWEPYTAEPDFLMDEIARLSNVVTREELEKLGQQFLEEASGESREKTVKALGFAAGFGGFRIFDHFRTPSTAKAPRSGSTNNLLDMSGHVPRRSVSKRSVATIDSSVGSSGSDSLMSAESQVSASTAATEYDSTAAKSSRNKEDRTLHEQVEGLLLALSEVQKEAADTAAQLRIEHSRKESMQSIVFRLKDLISKQETVQEEVKRDRRKTMPSRTDIDHAKVVLKDLHRKSNQINLAARSVSLNNLATTAPDEELQESLAKLCTLLETDSNPPTATPQSDKGSFSFFDQNNPSPAPPSISEPEPEPRPARTGRRDSVRFSIYGGSSQQSNAKSPSARPNPAATLWPSTSSMSLLAPSVQTPDTVASEAADYWPEASMFDPSPQMHSAPFAPQHHRQGSILHPRKSSLTAREVLAVTTAVPAPNQDEALLLELVNAKTREATAIHERDEMKQQIDRLRKGADAAATREVEWTNKMADMERLMNAQQQAMRVLQEAHVKELERYKTASQMQVNAAAAKMGKGPKSAGAAGLTSPFSMAPVSESRTERSGSLWPGSGAEPATPTKLSPGTTAPTDSGGSGWGWFGKKGRSVSTSSTA